MPMMTGSVGEVMRVTSPCTATTIWLCDIERVRAEVRRDMGGFTVHLDAEMVDGGVVQTRA